MKIVLAKLIFGINFGFEISNKKYFSILEEELSGYEAAPQVDVVIREVEEFKGEVLSNNPSIHQEYEQGFLIRNRILDTLFVFKAGNLVMIEFRLHETDGAKSYLRKLNNMQFTNRGERIGQLLHEKVLVPATFFMKNRMPMHCAAVQYAGAGALLFGGTGGVGKTSIEIQLASQSGVEFVSDDIAIVDDRQQVYKNLNFPKIYAYNTVGNPQLTEQLLREGSVMDKMHWDVTKKIKGIDKVRRRIAPQKIYGDINPKAVSVASFYFLFRKNVSSLELADMDVATASKMSIDIIKNEYSSLFDHIRWHEYNCQLGGRTPWVTMASLQEKWETIGAVFFANVATKAIFIPIAMNHQAFLSEVVKLVAKDSLPTE